MRATAIGLSVVVALGCSSPAAAPDAGLAVTSSSAVATSSASAPIAASSASVSASAVASASVAAPWPSPSVSALPPPRTSRAPIKDCEPQAEEEAFSCCSEESYARVIEMSRGRSLAECKRIDALPLLAACPTFFARGFHSAIETCMKDAMDRELDRRLVPLKRADPKAFHQEMALQKTFNDALRATCDDVLSHEPSTGDFRGGFRCATFLTELRTAQATAVVGAGIEITHPPATKVRRAKRFAPFAKALCDLPLWRGGAAPTSCQDRLLGEIEDTLARAAKF